LDFLKSLQIVCWNQHVQQNSNIDKKEERKRKKDKGVAPQGYITKGMTERKKNK
jgi:hypothetical protein